YAAALLEHLRDSGSPLADEPERVTEAAAMVQDKLRGPGDFEDFAGFLFRPVRMDPEAWAKVENDADAPRSLDAAERRLRELDRGDAEAIEAGERGAGGG